MSNQSGLFMPLTGKEDDLRLEDKYGMLQPDNEDKLPCHKKGKVSRWRIEDSPSEWLHSQSGKNYPKVISCDHKRSPHKTQSHGLTTATQISSETTSCTEILSDPGPSGLTTKSKTIDRNVRNEMKHDASAKWAHCEDSFHSEGFALEDTERPKFQIQPTAAKVPFRLSEDGVIPQVMVPASINQYLRDYQRDGIRFLYEHYRQKKGAILGDDMGLGKTIQVIGLLAALLGKQGNHTDAIQALPKFIKELSEEISDSPPRTASNPFLIIGPSAVMFNWLEELSTWGYFTARKFHGGDKDSCLSDIKKGKLEIIVTTFETFRDNVHKLQNIEWEAVIVDEVHKIKGMKAQITKALSLIKTPCRYGLTGTALQNNLSELFSILNWAWPGILGTPEEFNYQFVHVIEAGQKCDATKRELAEARKQKDKFAQIRGHVMLRRTKTLLADQLPTKEDLVVMCRLTDLQLSVYKAILAHPHMILILKAEDPCDCGRKKSRASCCYKYADDGTKTWALCLSYMHLLLKAANHCALLIPDNSMAHKMQFKRAREICEYAFKDYPQFLEQTRTAAFLTLSDLRYCGKMKILQGLLTLFDAAHDKVLVFSYSTRLLDIIEHYVMSKCHTYRRIDGKTSGQKRLDIVHQFNSDPDIFLCLISTKAGGLGLNLTGANRVVIFDPNWNPSHDLQAQDRAFRIGQTRNVKVFRFITAGTIEENIYLRQIYKQQLDEVAVSNKNARRFFQGIQGDKLNQGELFGIRNMFSLRTGNTCLTMDILQRNNRLEKGLENYDITSYVPPERDENKSLLENDEDRCEQLMGSESEEEDFLESILGNDDKIFKADNSLESPARKETQHSKYANFSLLPPSNDVEISTRDDSSNSEEEEFSLIPTLYPRSAERSDKRERMRNDFTVEDITFSKSAMTTVPESLDADVTYKGTAPQSGNKCSALSLIFSDSESDSIESGGNQSEKRQNAQNHKKKKKFSKPCGSANSDLSKKRTLLKPVQSKASKRRADRTEQQDERKMAARSGATVGESVNAVFEACGVLHTHLNPQVVGSSRAEDHMTHCAMTEVFDLHKNSQDPAIQCEPLPAQSSSSKKAGKRKAARKPARDHNSVQSVKSGSTKILLGQTPPGVQRQQWAELCRFKRSDPLDLAEKLVTSTPKERLTLLQSFYSHLHNNLTEVMKDLLQVKVTDPSVDDAKHDMNESPSKPKRAAKSENMRVPRTKSSNRANRYSSDQLAKQNYRRNARKRRQLTPCLLAGSTLESQDSLTAISPPIEPPSSEDQDSEGFSPVPPSKGKRRDTKLKSPVPKSTTRLRQKASNELARRKLFCKSRGRGLQFSDSSNDEVNQTTAVVVSTLQTDAGAHTSGFEQDREDVSTLLMEMAGEQYYRQLDDRPSNYKAKCVRGKSGTEPNSGGNKVCVHPTEKSPQPSHNSPPHSTADVPRDFTNSKCSKEDKTQILSKKMNPLSPQERQNYASLLDNIFSSPSLEKQSKVIQRPPSLLETVQISEKSTTSPKSSTTSHGAASAKTLASGSPVKLLPWNCETSSYDIPLEADTSAKRYEGEPSNEDHESLHIFDSLFKMSTLREETDGEKSSKRKKKGSGSTARETTRKIMKCKIDLNDDSQSLFS